MHFLSIRGQSLNHCSTVTHLWGGGEKLLMGLYNDIHVYVLSLYEGCVCVYFSIYTATGHQSTCQTWVVQGKM